MCYCLMTGLRHWMTLPPAAALTAARFSDVCPDDVDSGHDDVIWVPAGAAAARPPAPPHVLQVSSGLRVVCVCVCV